MCDISAKPRIFPRVGDQGELSKVAKVKLHFRTKGPRSHSAILTLSRPPSHFRPPRPNWLQCLTLVVQRYTFAAFWRKSTSPKTFRLLFWRTTTAHCISAMPTNRQSGPATLTSSISLLSNGRTRKQFISHRFQHRTTIAIRYPNKPDELNFMNTVPSI